MFCKNNKHNQYNILIISMFVLAVLFPKSLLLAVVFAAINYYGSKNLLISKNKIWFVLLLTINIFSIVFFKYFHHHLFNITFKIHSINYNLITTAGFIGFSFYTLQNIAYIVQIAYNQTTPAKTFLNYCNYILYFPRFISGPIQLYDDFAKQIPQQKILCDNVYFGLQRIAFGLFKKFVLSNRLAYNVSVIFDSDTNFPFFLSLYGGLLFTIRLYFDFSGYSDIAIGISRIFGIKIPENFNMPLRAKSIADFWRRWHISLINWLTTFVYYPIVFNMRTKSFLAPLLGISATFLLSGVWHGLGLTFFFWSLCHAVYLSVNYLFNKIQKTNRVFKIKIIQYFNIFFTLILVSFSNVFFRSPTFEKAVELLFSNTATIEIPQNFTNWVYLFEGEGQLYNQFNFLLSYFMIFVFLIFESAIQRFIYTKKNYLIMGLIILGILILGYFNNINKFIYTQF